MVEGVIMVAHDVWLKAKQVERVIDMNYPKMTQKESEMFINKFINYKNIWLVSEVLCQDLKPNSLKTIM
jgi:hypothetical protein